MGKGTKEQIELARRLHGGEQHSRIGKCIVPHCRTLLPAKNMYGFMCWFHLRMVKFWAGKVGFKMGEPHATANAYCEWLRQKAAGG